MPNTYNVGIDLPFSASGDSDTWQYHWVKPAGTAKRFDLATGGSGPAALGVLQNDPRSGEEATVRVFGTTFIFADATSTAIGYADWLSCGSDGQAIIAAGSVVQGIALQALASGASVKIEAYIFPPSFQNVLEDNTP